MNEPVFTERAYLKISSAGINTCSNELDSHDSRVMVSFITAICLPGCGEEHGFCDKPGECK